MAERETSRLERELRYFADIDIGRFQVSLIFLNNFLWSDHRAPGGVVKPGNQGTLLKKFSSPGGAKGGPALGELVCGDYL